MRHAQMQEGNEPDVVASRCENNVYDLTVAANCDAIKDTEAFAEKVVQKYEENSFRTTKFSAGHRGHLAPERFLLEGRDPDGVLRLQPRDGVGDDRDRRPDGVLHVPPLLQHLLGTRKP